MPDTALHGERYKYVSEAEASVFFTKDISGRAMRNTFALQNVRELGSQWGGLFVEIKMSEMKKA